jgi:hypothetical protein
VLQKKKKKIGRKRPPSGGVQWKETLWSWSVSLEAHGRRGPGEDTVLLLRREVPGRQPCSFSLRESQGVGGASPKSTVPPPTLFTV